MLFKQIYNWIKYKTLPPSFLFKNRLFIERDSKIKRIFGNVGLTFRNSKWNSYYSQNVQTQFKLNYFKYFVFFISMFALIVFFIKAPTLYVNSFFFNSVLFIFWFTIDTVDYYVAFFFWTFFSIFFLIKNLIKTYFFFNNFSFKNQIVIKKHNSFSQNLVLNKKDLRWFLLNWLNNSTANADKDKVLSRLFSSQTQDINYRTRYKILTNLFKNNILELANYHSSIYNLNLASHKLRNTTLPLITYFDQTRTLTSYTALLLDYVLNIRQDSSCFKINRSSTIFLTTRTSWNMTNSSLSDIPNSFLIKKTNNLFYTNVTHLFTFVNNSFSRFQLLNNEILNNQSTFSKWNRWLYRYNVLHRKSLKNIHKLTLSKKFLNSGFYNTDLTKKNLWFSEMLNKQTNLNLLQVTSNLFFFDIIKKQSTDILSKHNLSNSNETSLSNLNLLRTYENSFFWFMKRLYSQTNLSSNLNASLPYKKCLNTQFSLVNETNLTKYEYFLSKLASVPLIQIKSFANNVSIPTRTSSDVIDLSKVPVYLFFEDSNLFAADNLDILLWITSPSLAVTNQKNLRYFDYLIKTRKVLTYKQLSLEKCDFSDLLRLNKSFLISHSNLDNLFLIDLHRSSFF